MYKQLKELVTQYVDVSPESITRDSRFVEDLGFDSLDFIAIADMRKKRFEESYSPNRFFLNFWPPLP